MAMSLIISGIFLVIGLGILYVMFSFIIAFIIVTGVAMFLVSHGFSPLMSLIIGLCLLFFILVQPNEN
jgi:hypothetical protein